MANAWMTRDVRVSVPETVQIRIDGKLGRSVSAKDVMLYVMADSYFKDGQAIGQVLEFCGAAVQAMSMEERATLTNMAVEAGATTGFIAADEVTLAYIEEHRAIPAASLGDSLVASDASAHYAHTMHIDVSQLAPMVATPGDPRNGMPIAALGEPVRIDIAYGGSCTGGKSSDMEMYARVLEQAVARGLRVKDGVRFYIQFGSQAIRARAEKAGWVELFVRAGAELVNPSCGACINAGPGVSRNTDQVTVSAINRNFPRRSGPGKVYLASPLVVAASAIAGYITTPESLFIGL
jgi:3-isopropylmalate/(R)-2-methylmalate dehydratase large subunit